MVRIVKKSHKQAVAAYPNAVGSPLQADVDSVIVLIDKRLKWFHLLTPATANADTIAIEYPTSQHVKSGLWQVDSNFYKPPKLYQQFPGKTSSNVSQPESHAAELWEKSQYDVPDGKGCSGMAGTEELGLSDSLQSIPLGIPSFTIEGEEIIDSPRDTVRLNSVLSSDQNQPAKNGDLECFSSLTDRKNNTIQHSRATAAQEFLHPKVFTPSDVAEALRLYKTGRITSTRKYLFAGQPQEYVFTSLQEQNRSLDNWRSKLLRKQFAFHYFRIEMAANCMIKASSILPHPARQELKKTDKSESSKSNSLHSHQVNGGVKEYGATDKLFSPRNSHESAKSYDNLEVMQTSRDSHIADEPNEGKTSVQLSGKSVGSKVQSNCSTKRPNSSNTSGTPTEWEDFCMLESNGCANRSSVSSMMKVPHPPVTKQISKSKNGNGRVRSATKKILFEKAKKNALAWSKATKDKAQKPNLVSALSRSAHSSSLCTPLSDASNHGTISSQSQNVSCDSTQRPHNHAVSSTSNQNDYSQRWKAGNTSNQLTISPETPSRSDTSSELLSILGLQVLPKKQSAADSSSSSESPKVDQAVPSVCRPPISAHIPSVSCKSLSRKMTGSSVSSRKATIALPKDSANVEKRIQLSLGGMESQKRQKGSEAVSESDSRDSATDGHVQLTENRQLENGKGPDKIDGEVQDVDLRGEPVCDIQNRPEFHEHESCASQADLPTDVSTGGRSIDAVLLSKSGSTAEQSRAMEARFDESNASSPVDVSAIHTENTVRFEHLVSKHNGSFLHHENGRDYLISQPTIKVQRLADTVLYQKNTASGGDVSRVAKEQVATLIHLPVSKAQVSSSMVDVVDCVSPKKKSGFISIDSERNVSNCESTATPQVSAHLISQESSSALTTIGTPFSNCFEVLKTLLPSTIPISEAVNLESLCASGFKPTMPQKSVDNVRHEAKQLILNDGVELPVAEGTQTLSSTSMSSTTDANVVQHPKPDQLKVANSIDVEQESFALTTRGSKQTLHSRNVHSVQDHRELPKVSLPAKNVYALSRNIVDAPKTSASRKRSLPANTSISNPVHGPEISIGDLGCISKKKRIKVGDVFENLRAALKRPTDVSHSFASNVLQQRTAANSPLPDSTRAQNSSFQVGEHGSSELAKHRLCKASQESLPSSKKCRWSSVSRINSPKVQEENSIKAKQLLSMESFSCNSPKIIKDQLSAVSLPGSMAIQQQNSSLISHHGLTMVLPSTSSNVQAAKQQSSLTTQHNPNKSSGYESTQKSHGSEITPCAAAMAKSCTHLATSRHKGDSVSFSSSALSSLASMVEACEGLQRSATAQCNTSVCHPRPTRSNSPKHVTTAKKNPDLKTENSSGFGLVSTASTEAASEHPASLNKIDLGPNAKNKLSEVLMSIPQASFPLSTQQPPNHSKNTPSFILSDAPQLTPHSMLKGTSSSGKRINDTSDMIAFRRSMPMSKSTKLRSTSSASAVEVKLTDVGVLFPETSTTSKCYQRSRPRDHTTKVSTDSTMFALDKPGKPAEADVSSSRNFGTSKSSKKSQSTQGKTKVSTGTALSPVDNQAKPMQIAVSYSEHSFPSKSFCESRAKQQETKTSVNTVKPSLDKKIIPTPAKIHFLHRNRLSKPKVKPAFSMTSSSHQRNMSKNVKALPNPAAHSFPQQNGVSNKSPKPTPDRISSPHHESTIKNVKTQSKSTEHGSPQQNRVNYKNPEPVHDRTSSSHHSETQLQPAKCGSLQRNGVNDKVPTNLNSVRKSKAKILSSGNNGEDGRRPGNLLPSTKISGTERSQYFTLMTNRDGQNVEVSTFDDLNFCKMDINPNQAVPVLSLEGL